MGYINLTYLFTYLTATNDVKQRLELVYLVEASLWHLSEVHDQQMDVNWKPEDGKHDDHQYQSASDLFLLFVSAASGSCPGYCLQVIAA